MKRDYTHAFETPQQPQGWHPENRLSSSLPPLSSLISDMPLSRHSQQPVQHMPYPQQQQPVQHQQYMQPHYIQHNRNYEQTSYYGDVYASQVQGPIYSYASVAEPVQQQQQVINREKTPSPILLVTPEQRVPSPPVSPIKRESPPPKKRARKTKAPVTSPSSSGSDEEDLATALKLNPIPTVENPRFDFHQLQPIRILAYQIGLSGDPNKSYRYRDIKRALFEKCAKEHVDMVDNDPNHSLLHQRLPHKLSLAQFCKRVILLVFHHIVRDGREPRFWRQKGVRHELITRFLTECEPDFYSKVNVNVALLLHSYVAAGMTFEGAMKRIKDEGHMRLY